MEPDVLIIGGGATGTGLARDLALRGLKSLLVEKSDINAGASGGNHGLLHSGARYVSNDMESAVECMEEGKLLKKLAPHCIDDCGGLFVAVEGDDDNYIADFPGHCEKSGISCRSVTPAEALEMEPGVSDKTIAVYEVEDAAIDPFMLSLENIADAKAHGSKLMCHTRAVRFEIENHKIVRVKLHNTLTGEDFHVEPKMVVNASGAWAGQVAALAGASPFTILCSMGTLLVTQSRISNGVINRLRPPANADILVPGGTVSIIGTTSVRVDDPDDIIPTVKETDEIVRVGAQMVPSLERVRYIRAYSGVRPLVSMGGDGADDRNVSRNFTLLDHESSGVDNFVTITGGKLTTYRLMAEKTADLVCRKLGNGFEKALCLTRIRPLPSTMEGKWTEPGVAPKRWVQKAPDVRDKILCECEMISEKTIDDIAGELKKNGELPDLLNIGKRSRLGKGPCQGAFCSVRVLAHMYDKGALTGEHGVGDIKAFLNERWKGQRPIFWGEQLIQAELTEAMHSGFFDLELT
ncbi:sn-glycerol-3-phosphate dehydrogenase (anaerobic), large subunit, FAD/NAD(P)-binding [Desulfamplus magnetovallimortis]|uniref:Glycerol-3-phosphate dehydrogenase n=1 Tax=Desulfamplus magnetovallimortis TaxID=1246637 RepID=A0A1W1HB59_9BACT|nr:anaerobic glycerol-3-phosphate dehydrogenase subunit GlpA [Desulfamplus magnetovallimortis]SLM29741.1 sn-glycerol-3-phosphate dehydrogenase (anaerobic), large subunit, FAD/NAD(P)-binding [Desulfamplus magnetovallimortis]